MLTLLPLTSQRVWVSFSAGSRGVGVGNALVEKVPGEEVRIPVGTTPERGLAHVMSHPHVSAVSDSRTRVLVDEDMGLSGESGEQTVRVRDSDGDVHAEKSIPVDHYEDRPDLGVVPVSLEPETVAIGESADVSFGVETFGGDAEFTAELLVNDTSVETREGSIDGGVDCEGFSGPEFEFSHTFEKAGEYVIAGRIEVESHPEAGDSQDVGTVTVTE